MSFLIPIIIALIAIFIVWKLFAGLVKTVALVVILIAVAVYIFGVGV